MDPGKDETSLHAFPEGFRMVAGDPFLRSDAGTVASDAVTFACLDYQGPATKETKFLPNRNCPSGLRVQVYFPSCWNGKDMDSTDHKSHVIYGDKYNGGTCPPGFDTRLISIFYEVIWNTNAFKDMWYGSEQPFVFSSGDPTGYGYHGDFVNGWNVATLQDAVHNCRDGNTGVGGFGDINKCPPLLPLRSEADAKGCRIPPSMNEEVHGVLPALPGCNPITAGPGRATPQTGCGAPTTIGQPESFFTDVTKTKNFEYVGCGTDVAFQARTLSGPNTANDQMTVEKCIDSCSGQGFTYAGLEFGRECYCGNDVPADRAPQPGQPGNCVMKCAGDNGEYCGGYGTISLYKKCQGTCQNAQVGVVGNATTPAPSSGGSAPAPPSSPAPSGGAPFSGVSGGPTPGPTGPSSSSDGDVKAAAASSSPASTRPTADAPDSTEAPSGAAVVPSGEQPGHSRQAGAATVPTSFAEESNTTSAVKLPSGWRDVGCHVDPVNPRALKYYGWWGEAITSSGCVEYCDKKGYKFAGTEHHGQCFCDNELHEAKKAPAGECNLKCKGSDQETCGGDARLSLFTKLSSGAPKRSVHRRVAHDHSF